MISFLHRRDIIIGTGFNIVWNTLPSSYYIHSADYRVSYTRTTIMNILYIHVQVWVGDGLEYTCHLTLLLLTVGIPEQYGYWLEEVGEIYNVKGWGHGCDIVSMSDAMNYTMGCVFTLSSSHYILCAVRVVRVSLAVMLIPVFAEWYAYCHPYNTKL